MDKKELDTIRIMLHQAIDRVIVNRADSAGISSRMSYWCMLEEMQYIKNLLDRLK